MKYAHQGNRPERRRYPLEDVSVQHLLGQIVIEWNGFEFMCRHVLNALAGDLPRIGALTNELGGVAIQNALRAVAPVSKAPELEPIIVQLAEAYDRLRNLRNYYVHGANEAGSGPEGLLKLREQSAKGKLRVFEDEVDKYEMHEVFLDCSELSMTAFDIWCYLHLRREGPRDELPDMPFLPPKPAKSLRT